MNNTPQIIPTPAFVKYSAGRPISRRDGTVRVAQRSRPGRKEQIALQVLREAVEKLGGRVQTVRTVARAHIVLSLLDRDANANTHLTKADLSTFEKPNGAEQGYVIKATRAANAQIQLVAQDPQGLLYATVSLVQLLHTKDGRICWHGAHVRDWPTFRYRGNAWTIWVECGRWSYERGDGADAYARRIERKIDFSLQNKVNLIIFDGFGWNNQRFPGYADLMKRLAKYARERGIKLLFGGYGAGYGAGPLYDGVIFRNRRSYPNGRIYKCYRFVGRDRSATFGTCIANDALMKLKQNELRQFVTAVEPGALYIHCVDNEGVAGHVRSWPTRCEACRRRWPNDAIDAPDGAAGAFAELYDALCDAVFSVKNPKTGYKAARDCTPILVSPVYTARYESDADWDLACRYWAAISRLMKNVKNVEFGFREQFLREDGRDLRFREMRRVLDTDGKGHAINALVFAGAAGNDNDHLYNANPVLSKYYEGAESILNCSGHAYQEPLQMLNAEYAWRADAGAWFDEPIAQTFPNAINQYDTYRDGLRRPAGIFGPEGFLETACHRLYGPEAGAHMATVNRLMTADGEAPLGYLFNTAFLHTEAQWAKDVPPERARHSSTRWQRIADVTQTAATETRLAEALVPNTDPIREDLAWMADTFLVGREAAEIMTRYFALYAIAQDRYVGDKTIKLDTIDQASAAILRRIDLLEAYMTRHFSNATLDYLGGDIGHWPNFIASSRKRVAEVVAGVRKRDRGEPEPYSWW
ncbi:MAG: hypothetical protein CMJ49_14160 [Planctomycetaceae bacterium]|nr:hypothetical protein [Planctomycetaceae bacterium]